MYCISSIRCHNYNFLFLLLIEVRLLFEGGYYLGRMLFQGSIYFIGNRWIATKAEQSTCRWYSSRYTCTAHSRCRTLHMSLLAPVRLLPVVYKYKREWPGGSCCMQWHQEHQLDMQNVHTQWRQYVSDYNKITMLITPNTEHYWCLVNQKWASRSFILHYIYPFVSNCCMLRDFPRPYSPAYLCILASSVCLKTERGSGSLIGFVVNMMIIKRWWNSIIVYIFSHWFQTTGRPSS